MPDKLHKQFTHSQVTFFFFFTAFSLSIQKLWKQKEKRLKFEIEAGFNDSDHCSLADIAE